MPETNGRSDVRRQAREALDNRTNEIVDLEDEAVMVAGINVYGSPWWPSFYDWAFNLRQGEALARKWSLIPDDTDVPITHGLPIAILDRVAEEHVGWADL